MIEAISSSLVYSAAKDAWKALSGRGLSDAEILARREKWKPLFENHIWKEHAEGLRCEAVIRDMRRYDEYPHASDKGKGISPWFRVGLLNTYHRGILVGLRHCDLTQDPQYGWRYTKKGETRSTRAVVAGRIPFERIQSVDWSGDEYYNFPHIYCHFRERRRQPYEAISIYKKIDTGDPVLFYEELGSLEVIDRVSKRLKIPFTF